MAEASTDFQRGVRACITWLHQEAREMNDPHARAVLNNAAFHIGVAKPTGDTEAAYLRSLIAEAVKVLEPFSREANAWSERRPLATMPYTNSALRLGDFRCARALTERLKAALPE